jgi:flagellar M-ring protein FliF
MATNDKNMMIRVKDLAGRMTPLQKVALGAVVLTVVAGSLVLSRTKGSTEMGVLFTDLASADTSSVVDALSAQGVQYQLTDAGHTVLVPKANVYDLRVTMAGKGLPSSNQGYALLDQQGITTSEFRQRIDYQRALEGEIDKTLMAMKDVKSATVHLALPDQSVFNDQPSSPTASVLIAGSANGSIPDDEVQAIVHLVASAVKDMKPSDVTVVDANGNVLSAGGSTGGTGTSSRTKVAGEIEKTLSARIIAMLSKMTGPNKVSVTVNAQVDLDEKQSTSENFEPVGTTPGSSQVSHEKTSTELYGNAALGATTGVLGPDGVPVTATTLPVGGATASTVPGTGVDYKKGDVDRTYALDRTVSQTVKVPGTISRLNVAVLIDETAVKDDQIAAIEKMVSTAAGIDSARGDAVTITRMPFDNTTATEADKSAKEAESAASQAQMMSMARTGVIVLVIVIALFLAYRSAKSARRETAIPINIGELQAAARPAGSLAIEAGNRGDAAAAPAGAAPVAALPRASTPEHELSVIADQRPQEVANVLRAWLNESKVRR